MFTTERSKKIKDLVEAIRQADTDLADFAWCGATTSESAGKELEDKVDRALNDLDTFLDELIEEGE